MNTSLESQFTAEQLDTSNVVPNLTFYECLPTCYAPVVSGISSTTTSVTMSWYNEGDPVQVEIKASSAQWGDAPVTVTGYRHTFNWLVDGEAYDVRLRRVCGPDDYSEWVIVHATTIPFCSTPEALSASDITASTATIGWTDGPGSGPSDQWELHVWNNNGFDRYYDLSTNPATVDGLRANENYQAALRTLCGEGLVGEWSETMAFNNICYPATNVYAYANGSNVTVRWTAGERNQRWIVTYGYVGYDRNQRLGYQEVDTNVAVFEDLLPGHTYGFRVMAVCGEEWLAGSQGAEATATVRSEGIDDIDGNNIYLYPNPATASVTVGGMEGENVITVVDMDGRIVSEYQAHNTEITLDITGYARGAYFVRITGEHTSAVRKLVVR